jgi:hypothetical protein
MTLEDVTPMPPPTVIRGVYRQISRYVAVRDA